MSALGNEQALATYISSCTVKKCEFRNEAATERDALRRARESKEGASAEEKQFSLAHGNIRALKKYLSECQVCASGRLALKEIENASAGYENSVFRLRVCNEDHLPIDLATAGRRDPNAAAMWTVEGWWHVESGECANIGSFVKGKFYYHATNRRGTWGRDKWFCTATQVFVSVIVDGDCLEDEEASRFYEGENNDLSEFKVTIPAIPMTYSAVAVSGNYDITWGWGRNYPSQEAAEREALRSCNRADCRVVRAVSDDDCLVLAKGPIGDGGTYLYHFVAHTGAAARNGGRNGCQSKTGSACSIAMDSCKGR